MLKLYKIVKIAGNLSVKIAQIDALIVVVIYAKIVGNLVIHVIQYYALTARTRVVPIAGKQPAIGV